MTDDDYVAPNGHIVMNKSADPFFMGESAERRAAAVADTYYEDLGLSPEMDYSTRSNVAEETRYDIASSTSPGALLHNDELTARASTTAESQPAIYYSLIPTRDKQDPDESA